MQLDLSLLADILRCKKVENILTLVSLDLNDFAHLWIFDNSTVAVELLFAQEESESQTNNTRKRTTSEAAPVR
jgi:hypothetical protein